MAAAGGVALLAVAAGLMSPPPAPAPRATSVRTADATLATAASLPVPQVPPAALAVQSRDQRDPTAQATLAPTAVAAPPVPPPAPPAQRGEPVRAHVGDTDLGLRVLPGSRPVPDSGRRVPDGAGGEAVALSLAGSGSLDAAVQFYRQQLVADGLPADAVQVLRPGSGQALLRAPSPRGGEHTVWIVENGAALDIVLARVRPGPTPQR